MAKKQPSPKPKPAKAKPTSSVESPASYTHPDQRVAMRPDIGTQDKFRKKKPPVTWRYDSSLSPALDWDGQNGARELGEWLLARISEAAALPAPHRFATPQQFLGGSGAVLATVQSLEDAVALLKRLGAPFLTWTGKAERLSFDVPTMPLFVHERMSTEAIVETLIGHKKDKQQSLFDLFGDPQHSIADQVMRAYQHQDKWVNRMILGDSLVVMNSLLQYEGLGGQVQMIYIDPPYGVKFGSNFQPFVRKRDVSHNDDEDLTREPEMVKAYRDTWELGLHSYLTYMRDRLLMARELLTPSGSVFVQISDENLHHARELMDEVFGAENFCAVIPFRKKTMPLGARLLENMADYLVWYARDASSVRYRGLFVDKSCEGDSNYRWYEDDAGARHEMRPDQVSNHALLPKGARPFHLKSLEPSGVMEAGRFDFEFRGVLYRHPKNGWATPPDGMRRLAEAKRLEPLGEALRYVLFHSDYPVGAMTNPWNDVSWSGFAEAKTYVVQTNSQVIRRCMLMTTDPGDLVLDPTCGSGTTAYVAEQWGRRWITIDTSRVPMALARQRLLTATFDYYELKDSCRGPAGGFVYKRKQNKKGEEVGGIVPHVTLKSIANDEPADEEVLVDRPEKDTKVVRVSGPFWVEGTIPTPVDWDGDGQDDSSAEASKEYGSFVDRMIEVLRRSPVLHVGGGKSVTLHNVRPPAKALSLSAEAVVDVSAEGQAPSLADVVQEAHEKSGLALPLTGKPVAFVFEPENGAVSEKLVNSALTEARMKGYTHLYVVGFAVQPHARTLIDQAEPVAGIPATYVQATPDLMMGDLLKNMRSSQIFSVCGLPEIKVHPAKPATPDSPKRFQVELIGLDTFDPVTMTPEGRAGNDVPAWFLDTNYNELSFHVSQAFFPRTGAWNDLRKALKGDYDDSVWDHLAGTMSAPFEAGAHGQVAVKVIDDRGNELIVVKKL